MRIGNLAGRAMLITADKRRALDVCDASNGRFGPQPQSIYDQWQEFAQWAPTADLWDATPYSADASRRAIAVTEAGVRHRLELSRTRRGVELRRT